MGFFLVISEGPTQMTPVLPQQKLLLQILVMSGQLAVPSEPKDTSMWQILEECRAKQWIRMSELNPEFTTVEITEVGRLALKSAE